MYKLMEGIYLSVSDAQYRATEKYRKKAYDRLEVLVPKGKKANVQAHAVSRGESLAKFVNRAIDEAMERDNQGKT